MGIKWLTEVRSYLGTKVFLPASLDTTGWVDVSNFGDTWATYVDPKTGALHRCEDYYHQALREAGLTPAGPH